MVKLEVCIDSLESAINAIHGGAEELEVCSSLAEGGLTPTVGLVKQILCLVRNIGTGKPLHHTCTGCKCTELNQKPSVNIMIRCRAGSDFCYSETEVETMLVDLAVMKSLGVDRFVFGALTEEQEIDAETCKKIVSKASPLPVTFHRAFDVCNNTLVSIEKIIKLGFDRVLTSGQRQSVGDAEAYKVITDLMGFYKDRIQIMPGAGVNTDNVKKYVKLGCSIIHSSCKVARVPKIGKTLSMGTETGGPEKYYYTDKNNVIRLRCVLRNEVLRIKAMMNDLYFSIFLKLLKCPIAGQRSPLFFPFAAVLRNLWPIVAIGRQVVPPSRPAMPSSPIVRHSLCGYFGPPLRQMWPAHSYFSLAVLTPSSTMPVFERSSVEFSTRSIVSLPAAQQLQLLHSSLANHKSGLMCLSE